ncbi:MAG: CRTAC1 family protein [Puia sp.]|nr:CRTAC1 family protein [Puia sp.]
MKANKIIKYISAILLFAILSYREKSKSRYTEKEPPVSRKLMELYREGLTPIYDKDNNFYPQARLDFLDSLILSKSHSDQAVAAIHYLHHAKATTLLKLGDERQAVSILEDLVGKMGAETPNQLILDSWSDLALSYLRLGERNNCITGHSMGSCIFPIQGSGVYTDPSASEKAIDIYKAILQLNPDDLESKWLLNIAYMTLGQYPSQVPAPWLIPGLDTDTSPVKVKPFEDMAGDLQLNASRNMAGGSIIEDFDNDGYLDIVTSNWGLKESMHFYKNNGDGSFSDVSKSSGLDAIKGGLNIIQADYNNDGYTDIFVLRGAWLGEFGKQPSTLLRNNGDGTFTDVTLQSGLLSCNPTQTAVWADFNNDGWLDLFVGHETASPDYPHPSELYINNGDGTFTNIAKQAGCQTLAFMKGVTSADYNKDGWPDIFISTQSGHEILYRNRGLHAKIPQFVEATHEAGLDKDTCYTFPTWFWDYDNDGWPDIFVSGYPRGLSFARLSAAEALHQPLDGVAPMHLYHNNHDGTFSDVSKETGLDRPVFAMGANFEDIDNDGWLDMYLGTGDPNYHSLIPNRLFKNIGGKQFADVTRSARVGNLQKGHGVAFGDVDNDGDQDLFIETGGAFPGDAYYNSFYINPGQNDNNWISLQLVGVQSNRSAIGAHIELRFTEDGVQRSVFRDVNTGGSFGGSSLRKEIGIGRASVIDELIVRWPTSGREQVFKNIAPRQYLRIREDSDQPVKMDYKTLRFEHHAGQMKGMDMSGMGSMQGMNMNGK